MQTAETNSAPANNEIATQVVAPTPGPWEALDNREVERAACGETSEWVDIRHDGRTLGAMYMLPWEANMANARLASSAPTMLEALQAVRPLMIPGMNWTDETGQLVKSMVVDAIAKALGA